MVPRVAREPLFGVAADQLAPLVRRWLDATEHIGPARCRPSTRVADRNYRAGRGHRETETGVGNASRGRQPGRLVPTLRPMREPIGSAVARPPVPAGLHPRVGAR
jgi:hypothetical protein